MDAVSNGNSPLSHVSARPFLNVDFSGVTRQLLADTGATISGLETGFFLSIPGSQNFKRLPIPPGFKVTVASGSLLQVRAFVEVPLRIGKLQTSHQFLIVDNLSSSGILGTDFLAKHEFHINLFSKTIARRSDKFDFQGIPANDLEKQIHAVEADSHVVKDTYIPALSAQSIKIRIKPSTKKKHSMGYIDSCLGQNISVVEAVYKVKHDTLTALITNNSVKDITIPANMPIGVFTPTATHQISTLSEVVPERTISKIIPPMLLEKRKLIHEQARISAPKEIRQQFLKLLEEFHDVISSSPTDLGGTDIISHKVHLKHQIPIHVKQFQIPLANEEFVLDYVKDLLVKGVIEPSTSPYNCPIFVVPKPKGGKRIVLDFRRLNSITFQDKYVVRTVQSCIDRIGYMNGRIFSTLDLTSGFWQQNLDEDSRKYSAFTVPGNLRYQWRRTPMGMANSSHSFARLIDFCFRDVKSVLGYIDDLLCVSPTFETHLADLRECFSVLRKFNLKLNLAKCNFASEEVHYLGFHITPKGVSPSVDKTAAIAKAEPPKNVKQIREFVGLANYFRHLIPHYQRESCHLTNLLSKKANYKHGALPDRAQLAFTRLQTALASSPTVAFPRKGIRYRLSTDASVGTDEQPGGLGAVLTQVQDGKERIIACASRSLKQHEKNYSAFLLELAGCVWGIEHFHTYLNGQPFTLCTDHRPIESLSKVHTKTLNRLQELMNEYDMTVEYRPGPDNVVADYLSRNAINSLNVSDERLLLMQKQDAETAGMIEYLQTGRLPPVSDPAFRRIRLFAHKASLIDGILHFAYDAKFQAPRPLLWAPQLLRDEIVLAAHASRFAGHCGQFRTQQRVLQRFWWPSLAADVKSFIDTCRPCQRARDPYGMHTRVAPMHALEVPTEPNIRIHADLYGPLKSSSGGNKYVLTITDAFSKYADVSAITSKDAPVVAAAIFDRWISRFSCPKTILTDRGTEFANCVLAELCKLLDIDRSKTAAYHPQCNAVAETFNRTITSYLRANVSASKLDWEMHLPALMLSYNTQVHKSTLQSPFFLTYLHHPRLPSFDISQPRHMYSEDNWAHGAFNRLTATYRTVHRANEEARRAMLARHAHLQQTKSFNVGDQVLVYFPRSTFATNPKLHEQWADGYYVEKQVTPVTYVVSKGLAGQRTTVHVNRLKLVRSALVGPYVLSNKDSVFVQPATVARPASPVSSCSDFAIDPRVPNPADEQNEDSDDSFGSAASSPAPRPSPPPTPPPIPAPRPEPPTPGPPATPAPRPAPGGALLNPAAQIGRDLAQPVGRVTRSMGVVLPDLPNVMGKLLERRSNK